MYDYSCSIMNSSTIIGVSGARPHIVIVNSIPAESNVLMFMLCTRLMESYITNFIGSLAIIVMYVYTQCD